jgi:hypothetical protein
MQFQAITKRFLGFPSWHRGGSHRRLAVFVGQAQKAVAEIQVPFAGIGDVNQSFRRNSAHAFATSGALRMAETTQTRSAPAARTSPKLSRFASPKL